MKTIAFFSNKGGAGKTNLVYHLSWMLQELGIDTVALDLDPQANLTTAFLSEEERSGTATVQRSLQPLLDRLGDLDRPPLEVLANHLALVPGDLGLGQLEDRFEEAWPLCLSDHPAEAEDALRVTTAFYRVATRAAERMKAEIVLIDLGPSLGPLNRAALVASDCVIVPLPADFDSLQGLRYLRVALDRWRDGWSQRQARRNLPAELPMPSGAMRPAGYIVLPYSGGHNRWVEGVASAYHHEILGEPEGSRREEADPHCLSVLKPYRSLIPLAREARKPMFLLRPADGAIGSQAEAVRDCYREFEELAVRLLKAID